MHLLCWLLFPLFKQHLISQMKLDNHQSQPKPGASLNNTLWTRLEPGKESGLVAEGWRHTLKWLICGNLHTGRLKSFSGWGCSHIPRLVRCRRWTRYSILKFARAVLASDRKYSRAGARNEDSAGCWLSSASALSQNRCPLKHHMWSRMLNLLPYFMSLSPRVRVCTDQMQSWRLTWHIDLLNMWGKARPSNCVTWLFEHGHSVASGKSF